MEDESPKVCNDLDDGRDDMNVTHDGNVEICDAIVGVDHVAQVDHGEDGQYYGQGRSEEMNKCKK